MGPLASLNGSIDRLNAKVNDSFVGRYFEMKERGAVFSKEVRGASATFLSMAYILAVNPRILADSGGPCVPGTEEEGGIFSPEYEQCIEEIKREYVTATAIASMFGCVAMGLLANLPIALSAGMGMNAYFTYSVVGWRGTGTMGISYQAAVTAVMIEGAIFFFLAVTGIRYAIIRLIPEPVRVATPAGIGCFLAHLGLQTAEGLGVVVSDVATAVTLGACPPEKRTPVVAFTEECQADTSRCIISDAYTCDVEGGIMTSARTWLGIIGLLITAVMLSYKKRAAFVAGILFVTCISWFRNTLVTYFPNTPEGDARFEYFSQVVSIEPVRLIVAPFTNDLANVGLALVTFLYVDFLDTSGTLLALASTLGYVTDDGDFPKSRQAFAADALATMFGSVFGLSPVTSFIESAAGVEAGAKTGLAACVCAFYFLISIFFAPLIASIPPWATGGALVMVGALMCRSLVFVRWYDTPHAISAFLTIILMPLTYSIAYGLIAGIGVWFVMQAVFKVFKLFGINRYKPNDPNNIKNMKDLVKDEDEIEVLPVSMHTAVGKEMESDDSSNIEEAVQSPTQLQPADGQDGAMGKVEGSTNDEALPDA